MSNYLQPHGLYSSPDSSVHGIFQARILEWVAYFLLQGIFPTEGSNPRFLDWHHWQADSLPLSHQGSPHHNCRVASVISDCATLRTITARPFCPWDSPDENTGVGCHAFPQGIFPTQVLNPLLLHLLHCWQILYH